MQSISGTKQKILDDVRKNSGAVGDEKLMIKLLWL